MKEIQLIIKREEAMAGSKELYIILGEIGNELPDHLEKHIRGRAEELSNKAKKINRKLFS